jgi:hypothetical protein
VNPGPVLIGEERTHVMKVTGQDCGAWYSECFCGNQSVRGVVTAGPAEKPAGFPSGVRRCRRRADGLEHPVHRSVSRTAAKRLGEYDDRNPHLDVAGNGFPQESSGPFVAFRPADDRAGIEDQALGS